MKLSSRSLPRGQFHSEIIRYAAALITGRFIKSEMKGAALFTGSANQKIYLKGDLL